MSLFKDFVKSESKTENSKPKISEKTLKNRIEKRLKRKVAAKEILQESFGDLLIPSADGQYTEVFTTGQSNAGGFYEAIRDKHGTIDDMYLATWIMSPDYAKMLFQDIESGALKSLTMVISNRMRQLENKRAAYNFIISQFPKHPNIEFAVIKSHAKLYGMNVGGQYVNIKGSGNWSDNPRIENYDIINSKKSFEFNKATLLEFIGKDKESGKGKDSLNFY